MSMLTIRMAVEIMLPDGTILVAPGHSLTLPLDTVAPAVTEAPSSFEVMRVVAPFMPGRSRPSFDAISISGWLFQGEQITVATAPVIDDHGVTWRRVYQPGHSADRAYIAERLGSTVFLVPEGDYAPLG